MNSQSKASGGQKPAANKQTNQQRGLPRTRSGSNWNGSGVNPGATRFYTSNSEDVFENDAIDHTNFNNSTDPTMSSMHGINVTQERRDEEEVINYFIKFEHATIYSKLQRKESGLAATVEEENPIKLLSQFLKLVLEQYVEGTLSAHPLSRAVPSHVLNQVADVLTAIESKDETGTEESKSGVAKDTVTILGLANSVFIALLRSNGIVYADMMDSLAGICDWEDDTAELLKSRMDTAVKSLIDFYDNNLDLREVSRAQYVVSTDQSDELSTSVKHAICSAARSCLRSSVLNEEIQSQATLYLSYIHSRNGYAVEEDEEIQGEKKDDTQEEQIETLSQDAGLDPWTTTNLEYPIPVENDCKDVFVDIRSESIRSDDIAAQVEAVNASTERELSLSEQDYIRDIDVNRRFQDMFQYEMAAPQDDNSGPYMIESFSCMNRNENSSNRVMARKASGISPNLPRYMQPKSKSHSSPRSGSEKR